MVTDPTITTWPPLYSRDPRNNLLVWKIWAQDDIVYRTYGRVGGKLRDPVGRAIAGTAVEPVAEKQALLYAQRAWDRKAQASYSTEKKPPPSAPTESSPPLFPMHASTYGQTDLCLTKHLRLSRGAYIQPKLDGVRCVATRSKGGGAVLSSRTAKPFPWFHKIRTELEPALAALPSAFLGLDGEIYCEALMQNGRRVEGAERFGVISGMANIHRSSPAPDENQLSFYVFDCIDAEHKLSQTDRFAVLDGLGPAIQGKRVARVPTYLVSTPKEVDEYHDQFVASGFEGAVIRAKDLVYTPQRRSLQMRKYKRFDTAEFTIVGAKPGEGTESGAVVWVCRQKEGATFDCRPAAPIAERRRQFEDWPRYVGNLLTVQYQGLSADRIPRFPVGLGIRHEFIG